MCKVKINTIEELIAKTAKAHNQATISKNNAIDAFLTTNKRPDRDNVLKRRAEEKVLKEVKEDLESILTYKPSKEEE